MTETQFGTISSNGTVAGSSARPANSTTPMEFMKNVMELAATQFHQQNGQFGLTMVGLPVLTQLPQPNRKFENFKSRILQSHNRKAYRTGGTVKWAEDELHSCFPKLVFTNDWNLGQVEQVYRVLLWGIR